MYMARLEDVLGIHKKLGGARSRMGKKRKAGARKGAKKMRADGKVILWKEYNEAFSN
jgi:hypothetical protein